MESLFDMKTHAIVFICCLVLIGTHVLSYCSGIASQSGEDHQRLMLPFVLIMFVLIFTGLISLSVLLLQILL